MVYLFTDGNDKTIEHILSIKEVVPETITVEGVVYTRDQQREYQSQSFQLKGGNWPGRTLRMNKEMITRNNNAGKRTRDTWGDAPKMIPNHKGQICESWAEATSLRKKDKEG